MQTGGSKASVEPLECREAKAGKEEPQIVCVGREWISLAIYPSSKFSLSPERVKGIQERKQHLSPIRTTKEDGCFVLNQTRRENSVRWALLVGTRVPFCPE